MEEQLIKFSTAKLAKEKGCYITNNIKSNGAFSENTVQFYNDSGYLCTERDYDENCCVPTIEDDYSEIPVLTQSLLQRWLREEHKILVVVLPWKEHQDDVNAPVMFRPMIHRVKTYEEYPIYENALEKGLEEALNLIK